VIVTHIAWCCPTAAHSISKLFSSKYSFYISSFENEKDIINKDKIVKKFSHHLHEEEETILETISSSENPKTIDTTTKICIPQALQEIIVYINEGHIKSGDTLEMSLSEENNKILITKISAQGKEILALLYSKNDKYNKITIA
jgi:hypothetical protein